MLSLPETPTERLMLEALLKDARMGPSSAAAIHTALHALVPTPPHFGATGAAAEELPDAAAAAEADVAAARAAGGPAGGDAAATASDATAAAVSQQAAQQPMSLKEQVQARRAARRQSQASQAEEAEEDAAAARAARLSDAGLGRPSLGGRGTARSGVGCVAGLLAWPQREVSLVTATSSLFDVCKFVGLDDHVQTT